MDGGGGKGGGREKWGGGMGEGWMSWGIWMKVFVVMERFGCKLVKRCVYVD